MLNETLASLARAAEFFGKGGYIGYFILACSLAALAIIIERSLTYRAIRKQGGGWFDSFLSLVEDKNFGEASDILEGRDHPSARVLSALLDKFVNGARFSRNTLEKLANHFGRQEVSRLERYLPTLSTIGNIAPLLGLMGTVLGMVKAFMKIEALQGKVNASVLAGGIWEALLTTLFGLAVAIPAVIAHNYLSARVASIAEEIQDHAVSFVDAAEELNESDKNGTGGGP